MTEQNSSKPTNIKLTAAQSVGRAAFLALGLVLLVGLFYVVGAPDLSTPERIGFATGRALVPWGVGFGVLVMMPSGKPFAWSHIGISALAMAGLAMMLAVQGLAGRARAEPEAAGQGGWEAFFGELRRDYPDVFAKREAIMAQSAGLSKAELTMKLQAVTAPTLHAARARANDDLARRGTELTLDEYRQAMARSPAACWGIARGGAAGETFTAETQDREFRLLAQELRDAAHGSSPPGPVLTGEERRALVHRITVADAADKEAVRSILLNNRTPASDEEARAFCRWQITTLEVVLKSGPVLTGKFVRGS